MNRRFEKEIFAVYFVLYSLWRCCIYLTVERLTDVIAISNIFLLLPMSQRGLFVWQAPDGFSLIRFEMIVNESFRLFLFEAVLCVILASCDVDDEYNGSNFNDKNLIISNGFVSDIGAARVISWFSS